jgi:predicted nucleic acid-binding protein
MSAEYFLDTNILVYDIEAADARKQSVAQGLIERALEEQLGIISYQVAQECLNVITQKAERPLSVHQAEAYLDQVLTPLCTVFPSMSLYHRALSVKQRWHFGFYDSLIVSAALEAGCETLFTEDLQHGQVLDGLRVVDPFRGLS